MRKFTILVVVAAAFALSAATCTPTPADIEVHCIPLRVWTKEQQNALGAALAPIPESSPVWDAIKDWQMQRAAIKACNHTTTTP